MFLENDTHKPVIDWLTYRSYETNRMRSPHIAYYKWRKIYKDAVVFEEIFESNFKRISKEGVWGNDTIYKQ
jgi:hypothetical protein